ncbi:MAG: pyridoxal phosphate-dependent aminotransferase [Candidatus Wallbacteria bacterium]|nr:pyridoxal phosphate-dependent aminotransferase [Candidatus Wallbacteria bacterium]
MLDLTVSNPTAAGIEYPVDWIAAALGSRESCRYEPHPQGLPRARRAVGDWYAARGASVPPERVMLTASTSESYAFLFKLLCDPGDNLLVPVPSYPLFEHLASMESVEARPYALAYHGRWAIEMEALEASVDSRTRAVILVHPNNPTGSFVRQSELDALTAIARERGLALISDEVFNDYAMTADRARRFTLCGGGEALTFALGGLSKASGLPQLKLGWIVASGPDGVVDAAWERLELVADTYLSVGAPVQHALAALLGAENPVRERIASRVAANFRKLGPLVAAHGQCEALPVEGGWTAVLRLPRTRTDEDRVLELLREEGVLVHPGYFFDFSAEGFVVVSLLPPPQVFEEGVSRLLARAER